MATASHIISSTSLTFPSPQTPSILPRPPSFLKLKLHTTCSTKCTSHLCTSITTYPTHLTQVNAVPNSSPASTSSTNFYGVCYVVRDDVDIDQIIPTEYSTLNPSYPIRFGEENGVKSKYSIIIAGNNFGCGSSSEHATAALSAAGARAVVAESFDGTFFKNSNSFAKILALESEGRMCEEFKTGDVATIDVEERVLVNQSTGKVYQLKGFC